MDNLLGNLSNLKVDTVLSAVDKYVPGAKSKISNLADKAKAAWNNASELELKVLEATNHDPWGPHGSVMQEITNSSFHSEGFYQIMGVIDQRLSEAPESWRLVYKALLLLEYMLKHGPMSVAEAVSAWSRLSHLEKLRDRFQFKEASGRDQGINVRQRAGAIVALVQDREALAQERDKAAKNKSKYTGVSSGASRYGGFAGGASASSSSSSFGAPPSQQQYGGGSSSSASYDTAGGYGGHSSSSSYQRSTSGGGGGYEPGAAAAAAAGAAPAADAVEATRQRIARLKAEGALAGGAGGGGGAEGGAGPGLESPPDGNSPKKPKKLSEIRINPAISAAFGKGGGLAPPPASGSSGGARPAAAAAASGIDLLGDLDAPAAAPAPAAAAALGAAGLDEWDGFASAATPAAAIGPARAAGGDEWAAFDSAPAAGRMGHAQQQKQPIDINSLLGPLPTTAAGGAGPLPLDDFCTPPPAAAAAAPPPLAAAAGGFDPFAASSAVHVLPKQQQASGAPKLGPETAKAKDPFADLAFV